MYRSQFRQLSFDQFILPFDGQLDPQNRWVKLADVTPWFEAEQLYAKNFTAPTGMPAYSVRIALGSLIIKEKLWLSDEETVAQIQENPYLQYFIGLECFTTKPPFDPSLMTHFRKRLDALDIADIQAVVHRKYLEFLKRLEKKKSRDNDGPGSGSIPVSAPEHENPSGESTPAGEARATGSCSDETAQAKSEELQCNAVTVVSGAPTAELEEEESRNKGQLILDATCAPADIAWPTDLNLLNDAREKTEKVIDQLHAHAPKGMKKPRTYRQKARRDYLNMAKKRQKQAKALRRSIGKQLSYLERNLRTIDALMRLVPLTVLDKQLYLDLLVCTELYRQQKEMHQSKSKRCDNRIVSIAQPHVRPIVRGKASAKVEFGMKISISVVMGWCTLDRMSWNAYNEGGDLKDAVEQYRKVYGGYPESVHADKIYRTKENLQWCKKHNIRLSGVPLGRPPKDPAVQAERKRQIKLDEGVRNAVEGKFGQAKRKFGMQRIKGKLPNTSKTMVALIILVMNLQKLLEVHFLRQIGGLLLLPTVKMAEWCSLGTLKFIWSAMMSQKSGRAETGHFAHYSIAV